MILYELKCSNGHQFEAWFKDSVTYDHQEKRGEVECPICSDVSVSKAIMAPAVSTSRKKELLQDRQIHKPTARGKERAAEVAREILEAVGKIQKHVEDNCDYVGDKFADEARAIYYGDAEERGIYGEATDEEAMDLIEEDIPVSRIPWRKYKDS
ncbi:MAG: hypothetical protein CMM26_07780 [Rhodospirillaceae bacterium]|nr:hypothetical protein [Rhodospirillaceae bacterium]